MQASAATARRTGIRRETTRVLRGIAYQFENAKLFAQFFHVYLGIPIGSKLRQNGDAGVWAWSFSKVRENPFAFRRPVS